MAPPINQTITTAIDIGTVDIGVPLSYVQQQDDGGVTYPCWWSFTVGASLNEIGARAYGNFTTWAPAVTIWRGPTGAPSEATGGGRDVWNQVSCTPGEVLYIKSIKPAGNVVPAITTVEVEPGALEDLAGGDIVHPDSSTPDYSAVVLNPTTGAVKKFLPQLGWTGTTAVLRTYGLVAIYNALLEEVQIYDAMMNYVATPALPAVSDPWIIGTDGVTGWWCVRSRGGINHSLAYFVDPTGAVTLGPYDMGATSSSLDAVAPNLANTILYWVKTSQHGIGGYPVSQIVLSTLTVTDFLAGTVDDTSGWMPAVLTVLADGSLILCFSTNSGTPNFYFQSMEIRQYSDAAALLNTWDIFSEIAAPQWLFTAVDDPVSFWAWCVGAQTAGSPGSKPWNKYFHFTVASASVPTPLLTYQFIEGTSQQPGELAAEPFGTDWGSAPFINGSETSPTTTTYPIRRQRRFLLPSSPDNKRVTIPTMELLLRTGIGTADVPEPQVMMRLSKDGGKTWGPERWRSAGAVGRWANRVRWLRATGKYRNAVCEITVTDPVDWQFLAVEGDPVEGSS